MCDVIIKGFKSSEEAQMFIEWYEGQGEQDIQYWREARVQEGARIENTFYTNIEKTYPFRTDESGNLVLVIK